MRLIPLIALFASSSAFAGAVQTVTLDVQNMTCSVCPITVKKALENVPGVEKAKIDFLLKTAFVRYDASKATRDALTKATADAGFPATIKK